MIKNGRVSCVLNYDPDNSATIKNGRVSCIYDLNRPNMLSNNIYKVSSGY